MLQRTRAREVALQLLYQREFNPTMLRADIERFATERLGDEDLSRFSLELYDGVVKSLKDIDARLSRAAQNWKLHRMAAVDRNLLRLGAFEVLAGSEETPLPVAIDEAVNIARRYGSANSSAFVNGVLDRVGRDKRGAK